MFAITKNARKVFDKEITTFTREIDNANILEAEAGTNGYQGGDFGHGSRSYFRIENLAGTDMEVHTFGIDGTDGFEVSLGGDCELSTIITALKFITQALEDGAMEVQD